MNAMTNLDLALAEYVRHSMQVDKDRAAYEEALEAYVEGRIALRKAEEEGSLGAMIKGAMEDVHLRKALNNAQDALSYDSDCAEAAYHAVWEEAELFAAEMGIDRTIGFELDDFVNRLVDRRLP